MNEPQVLGSMLHITYEGALNRLFGTHQSATIWCTLVSTKERRQKFRDLTEAIPIFHKALVVVTIFVYILSNKEILFNVY